MDTTKWKSVLVPIDVYERSSNLLKKKAGQ